MEHKTNHAICSLILIASIVGFVFSTTIHAYAQSTHSEGDSTPISAVIMITSGDQGNPVFSPMKSTIKQGQELLVLNNLTETHTFTNGNATGDAMDGKIFSVKISPGSFAEYLASNIQPGNYSFYSETDPSMKGQLVIQP